MRAVKPVQVPPRWSPPTPLPGPVDTERLAIRFFEPPDAASLHEAVDSNRKALLPWLPWAATDHRTESSSLEVIARFERTRAAPDVTDFVIGLFDRGTGAVVGGTGFHRIRPAVGQAEIGYWIRGDQQGRGLCTEAVRAMLGWGFRSQADGGWGFRRIEIACDGANVASARVPQKLGLRLESVQRKNCWVDGIGFDDTLIWGVLVDEWLSRSS